MTDASRGARRPTGSGPGQDGADVTMPIGAQASGGPHAGTALRPAPGGSGPRGSDGAAGRQRSGAQQPAAATRGPRRARLTVRRVDPWSVLKFTFVFSIALLVVWVVAVGLFYGALDSMGVFDKLNSVLADFTTKDGVAQWQINLSSSRVIGWAALLGGVNAVLFTALGTLSAFIYNLCSSLSGGLDVTLTERD